MTKTGFSYFLNGDAKNVHCAIRAFWQYAGVSQIRSYMSWKPDQGALATDTLSQQWTDIQGYAFPLFSLIGRCLTKVCQEKWY